MLVLVVEDNRDLASNIIDFLALDGIECDYSERGKHAIQLIKENRYDAVVLDINLPDTNGFDVCKKIRETHSTIPILMLTARDSLPDKQQGFDAGTDDYLVKPFALPELEMRLIALSKRSGSLSSAAEFKISDLKIDEANHEVIRANDKIQLPLACWKILLLLANASPAIVTRDQLELKLWPESIPPTDSLKAHFYTLRKLIDKPYSEQLIHSVRGVGYCLKACDD